MANPEATTLKTEPKQTQAGPEKLHTWPHLVAKEFLCGLLFLIVILLYSYYVDAPLRELANPGEPENPAKAPWYFLGLQEELVYFDPWFAGVVLPSLIIIGLMVIPYIDPNPKGNGYYTFGERKFAVTVFCFGFLLWYVLILITAGDLSGPGSGPGRSGPWPSQRLRPYGAYPIQWEPCSC